MNGYGGCRVFSNLALFSAENWGNNIFILIILFLLLI
jgi:hypothetical protein